MRESIESNQLYGDLLKALAPFGPFQEEVKKTSIHLVRASAFAGVHPRKHGLLLTIQSLLPIDSPRVLKVERVSENRCRCDVKLTIDGDIDDELLGWLHAAYNLCG